MRIAFERFAALTAALATVGGALSACSSDNSGDQPGAGGTVKSAGGASSGGKNSGGKAGSSMTGGSHSGGASETGGTNEGGASGGSTTNTSGGSSNEAGVSGWAGAESAGATGASSGGATSGGNGGLTGGESSAGSAGDNAAGAAGAPNEACLGDVGIADCSGLGLPTDECTDLNPLLLSCVFSVQDLRQGVLQGLGQCLLSLTTPLCTIETEDAVVACETQAAARACPTEAASDACANGISLQGGGTIAAPLSVCTDGTLTQQNCEQMLSAVTPMALPEVAKCADPAGEYGYISNGTCVERLHSCLFPHRSLYPW